MAQLFLVRLPNTNLLGIQSRPFDPETFEEEEEVEEEEDGGKTRVETVIRWRESRETGERQSNARVVTWSDGSMTLHVGSEVLVAQQVPIPEGTTHLYTRHQGSHLECHGVLKHKLTLAPASRDSKAHQALTHKIARVHTKGQKMQFHSLPFAVYPMNMGIALTIQVKWLLQNCLPHEHGDCPTLLKTSFSKSLSTPCSWGLPPQLAVGTFFIKPSTPFSWVLPFVSLC